MNKDEQVLDKNAEAAAHAHIFPSAQEVEQRKQDYEAQQKITDAKWQIYLQKSLQKKKTRSDHHSKAKITK